MAMLKRINSKIEDLKDPKYYDSDTKQKQQFSHQQWTQIKIASTTLKKRAHHASCIEGNKMYIHGGYEANGQGILSDLNYLNLQTKQWHQIKSKNSLKLFRHSHSMVIWNSKLIVFGGIINSIQSTNKVFSFDLNGSMQWKQQICTGQIIPALNSHKAVIYKDTMIVFGGEQSQKYSQSMYSLNLKLNQWKTLCNFTLQGIPQRSDISMTIDYDKIYIFGGKKDDIKYNQLLQYNIPKNQFIKHPIKNQFQACPRSGHSSCIYNDNLIIFGGTTGITHERNDLVIYNLITKSYKNVWTDDQDQKNQQRQTYDKQNSRILKKSRSNSVIKKGQCSVFNPAILLSGSKCNQKNKQECQRIQNSNITNNSTRQKYRQKMKNENYYNQNYPFYGDKQGLFNSKHKKNDLLVDLQKQTKQDYKSNHGLGTKKGKKLQLHLSQTFQSLNTSILSCLIQNAGKIESSVTNNSDQKSLRQTQNKLPKARDGHSCQIFGNQMIMFGGDRHHISFNDTIIVNLDKILHKNSQKVSKF